MTNSPTLRFWAFLLFAGTANSSNWMTDCVGEYREIPADEVDPRRFAASYWGPMARLYEIPTVNQRITECTNRRVLGTQLSAAQIQRRLSPRAFLWGAAVGDALRGHAASSLEFAHGGLLLWRRCQLEIHSSKCEHTDLEVTVGNTGDESATQPADSPKSRKAPETEIRRFPQNWTQNPAEPLQPLRFIHWEFHDNPTDWDYTVDSLAYLPSQSRNHSGMVLDVTDRGVHDLCRRLIRIPTHQWEIWANMRKIFRYWKLRAEGFQPSGQRIRSFVIERAKKFLDIEQMDGGNRIQHLHDLREAFCINAHEGRYSPERAECSNAKATADSVQKFAEMFTEDTGKRPFENLNMTVIWMNEKPKVRRNFELNSEEEMEGSGQS